MGKIIKIKKGVYKGVIKQDKENKNSGRFQSTGLGGEGLITRLKRRGPNSTETRGE